MFKRVFLFLITNILVIATISIVISLLGLQPYLTSRGIDYKTLAIFCAIWGTGGAFISLLISKWVAKTSAGVQVIDPSQATGSSQQLLNIVYSLARKLNINKMPEVGIYDSPELNAFATGPTKNSSLVAVSSGLLNSMNEREVEAVLGHEMSHVSNGDMVTMTLIQGIVNAFALFLSRIIAFALSTTSRGEGQQNNISWFTYSMFATVFSILFTLLGSLVVAAFSRWREYRADYGGARLIGKDAMINALRVLQQRSEVEDTRAPSLNALKINHQRGWLIWFSSHPPLEMRIRRLQEMR